MSPGLDVPLTSPGPLADVVGVLGLLAACAWTVWRFGPTLLRVAGWSWWWVAWACGSQGGYGYCAALLVLGTLAWGAGTAWYARRRGRWPSPLSARLFPRLLGRHSPIAHAEPPAPAALVPLRRR